MSIILKPRHMATVVALVLSSCALPGWAGGAGHFAPEYDLNGDSQLTPEEVQQARAAEFSEIDANADGSLSLAELQAWQQTKISKRFSALDSDANGLLSATEFAAGQTGRRATQSTKIFKLADTNADGSLSLAEFAAIGPDNGHLIHMFARLDSNDDDVLSKDEYLAVPTHAGRHGGGQGRP